MLVADDAYSIYLYEPDGYNYTTITYSNADLVKNEKEGAIRKITLLSKNGGTVNWEIAYSVK